MSMSKLTSEKVEHRQHVLAMDLLVYEEDYRNSSFGSYTWCAPHMNLMGIRPYMERICLGLEKSIRFLLQIHDRDSGGKHDLNHLFSKLPESFKAYFEDRYRESYSLWATPPSKVRGSANSEAEDSRALHHFESTLRDEYKSIMRSIPTASDFLLKSRDGYNKWRFVEQHTPPPKYPELNVSLDMWRFIAWTTYKLIKERFPDTHPVPPDGQSLSSVLDTFFSWRLWRRAEAELNNRGLPVSVSELCAWFVQDRTPPKFLSAGIEIINYRRGHRSDIRSANPEMLSILLEVADSIFDSPFAGQGPAFANGTPQRSTEILMFLKRAYHDGIEWDPANRTFRSIGSRRQA